jgi:sugar transferase (PEP-CTERM/EpsH1 system associated)
MHILFVASRLPYPPLQGDRRRAYHQLRLLSRQHRVTLVAPVSRRGEAAGAAKLVPYCAHIELVPVSPWRGAWRAAWGTPTGLPWQTLYSADPALSQRVRIVLQREPVDLAHVQLIRGAPTGAVLSGVPRVLDFIDALSLNMARRAERQRGLMAWLWRQEAARAGRYERELIHQFTRLVITTEQDRAAIGDYPNLRIVPNGVDSEQFSFVATGREPALLVFSGRLGYFPNADAAAYLVEEILPLIRRQVPEAQVALVGADPPARVRRLERVAGVKVTGYVESVHAYLARAAVAVVPMRAGTGMQLKMLEAMASGAPVVATPFALGGLPARDGAELYIAHTTTQFAERVVELLRDRALRARLALNARRMVEAHCGWGPAVEALERVYAEAVAAVAHASGGAGVRV